MPANEPGPADVATVGLLVDDLETASATLSEQLGCSWRDVEEVDLRLATPTGIEELHMRYRYAAGVPPYLQLLERQPAGFYGAHPGRAVRHVAFWVDDIAVASDRWVEQGLERGAWGFDDDGRVSLFAFHLTPDGARVELVDRRHRDRFRSWLGGEPSTDG